MLNQRNINITIGVVTLVIIVGLSWFAISTNNRLSYLEGKTSLK